MKCRSENRAPFDLEKGYVPGIMSKPINDSIYRPLTQTVGTGTDALVTEFYYDGADIPGFSEDDVLGFYVKSLNHRTGAVVRRGNPLTDESILVWPEFDDQGRPLHKDIHIINPSVSAGYDFEYDSQGNLNTIGYPSGIDVQYSYGVATNLLDGISLTGSSGVQTLANTFLHNPVGGLAQVVYGNGVNHVITPDNRNRPASRLIQIGSDDLVNESYGYDAFGNIDQIGSTAYVYDNLNRLTDVTGLSGRDFSYGYDSVGNMELVAKTSPVESTSFTYNSNNQVSGLTYDFDGNLTDDGVNTYVYDGLGQTTSVTNLGGTVSYVYDALGKRIVKSDLSGDVVYMYLGELLLSEYDPSGLVFTDSLFMGGQLLARVVDDGVSVTDVSFAHINHLGSPVAFTDGMAAVVWPEQSGGTPYEVHAYEPFGADFDDIGAPVLSEQDVRYTGKLLESETGKHYFNARYLNAMTDVASPELPPRFLSPDIVIGAPDSPQSWNRYASCLNNPVNLVDPDGLAENHFSYNQDKWAGIKTQAIYLGAQFVKTMTLGYVDYTDVGDYKVAATGSDWSGNEYTKEEQVAAGGMAVLFGSIKATKGITSGSFSITKWEGYPSGLSKPKGPFRLIEGSEYEAARKASNQANVALRRADPAKYAGKQIHEIHPVKYGGSPTDPANKIALTPAEHAKYTTFWNRLMKELQ